jgi:GH35 family endo-1,4-beta-xylanase
LNYATTLAFFLVTYEPTKGKVKPEIAEAETKWLNENGFKVKGHPLVYLIEPSIPKWLRGKDFNTLKEGYRARILRDVARFKGRIYAWDTVNEAHAPNPNYKQTEIMELTGVAAKAVREADPSAIRVVNITMAPGDYVAVPGIDQLARSGHTQTPYAFLKGLQSQGIGFEAIGLELYYPSLDMMELSRLLDKYAKLGKTIHVTELGVSSNTGKDPSSQLYGKHDFSKTLGEWHHPWDEDTQADWVEQFYTIAYSKPSIKAITYTHVTDTFWPYGGLFRNDMTPKRAFVRLQQLLGSWRVRSATQIRNAARPR